MIPKRRKEYIGKEACVLYLNQSGTGELVFNGTVVGIDDTNVVLRQKYGEPKIIPLERVKKITV